MIPYSDDKVGSLNLRDCMGGRVPVELSLAPSATLIVLVIVTIIATVMITTIVIMIVMIS